LQSKQAMMSDLQKLILFLVFLLVTIGLFFVLKGLLSANSSGVLDTLFGGLGFK